MCIDVTQEYVHLCTPNYSNEKKPLFYGEDLNSPNTLNRDLGNHQSKGITIYILYF